MEASDQLRALTMLTLRYLLNSLWGGEGVELWWPEPVWKFWRREKSLGPARIQSPDCPTCSLVTILFELSQVLCYTIHLNVAGETKCKCNSLTVGSVKVYLCIFVKAS